MTAWLGRGFESHPPEATATLVERPSSDGATRSQELIETLDRLVTYQHYYRSIYGHYTRLLGKIGYTIPASVADSFDIRVIEASSERLLLSANAEQSGVVTDTVSIDQDYRVRASFELPPPREEFLRSQALRHLRALRDAPSGRSVAEAGVYRDYFRFEIRQDSQARRVATAVGLKGPVQGLRLDVEAREAELASGEAGPLESETASVLAHALGLRKSDESRTGERAGGPENDEYLTELSRLSQAGTVNPSERERSPATALLIEPIEAHE